MEKEIGKLIEKLSSENGIVRQKARHDLVEIGREAIDYLEELQFSENHIARWEAIKALSQIGDSLCISILINALEDEKFDVRWLAADGLINIGKEVVNPLMEALISNKDSIYLKEGVHHVLKELEYRGKFSDKFNILKQLENDTLELPLTAHKIIKEVF